MLTNIDRNTLESELGNDEKFPFENFTEENISAIIVDIPFTKTLIILNLYY